MARDEIARLWRTAQKLGRAAALRKPGLRPLPPLLFVTDPRRTPDPVVVAGRLPRGSAVVYRAFGDAGALSTGRRLAAVARRRGLVLLVGADEGLAAKIGAHGVHLPERLLSVAPRLRARRPGWIVTGATHGRKGLAAAARYRLDAALLSVVFESRSPSAGRPLGPVRFARLARGARLPVYALGGVNRVTAARLAHSGAAGLAAVEVFTGAG